MLIGIPRSVFFYYYFPFWSGVLEALKISYIISPPTNPEILKLGLESALDEFCLPVKIHLGHVDYLSSRVDYVFSPGFGRAGKKSHFCPKLMGLPDVVRLKTDNALEFWHDLDDKGEILPEPWWETLLGIIPGLTRRRFKKAWENGQKRQAEFVKLQAKGFNPQEAIHCLTAKKPVVKPEGEGRPSILVLGHPYLVYDDLANLGLLQKLKSYGVKVITKEITPPCERAKPWPAQGKTVYWQLGQEILSAARYYAMTRRVDGIIFLSACLCGPDAITGELLELYMGQEPDLPPLLKLTVDEHTGVAGMETRVEAFMDLMGWRRQYVATV
ncbi:MAG TPA: hypothetical protein GX391_03565 [Firmicutes bacterium]|mgnify:CR=1 FL=1|jgi:predicted nucleotide-binding protein (sugar kinase/HSP70/actin superfamily)|nr:hypothetical protein [Bacillota bacterium]HOQ24258.1 acyl-CoA dehydratase activase-related protein [Bacillota bacterium]HPT66466.1 acyl-CoA dehydratase activase-related protein [Bacillota bacterium]